MSEMQRVWLRKKDDGTVKALFRRGDVYAKVYAVKYATEFDDPTGMQRWRFTGSHCDAEGNALSVAGEPKVHPISHPIGIGSAAAADVAAEFMAALHLVAERVCNAVEHGTFDPLAALQET